MLGAERKSAMSTITFVTANYVARVVGFRMTGGWGQGDRATNDYFRPIETYRARFDELLGAIQALGFQQVDLWNPHLNWTWATEEHIAIARDVLAQRGMSVASMAGGFGDSVEEFERACQLAAAIGMPMLGGSTAAIDGDRDGVVALLEHYDLRLALENHPQIPTPEAMLMKIGDGGAGRVGTAIDTGWYASMQCDAAKAIDVLGPHIMHVHLKDVHAPKGHETCRFGQGIVPLEVSVAALQRLGYRGPIAIEDEPEMHDPSENCVADLQMLRRWLAP